MSHRQGIKRILVAVDGSEVAARAAEQAVRIAKQDGALLFALHVVPSPPFEGLGDLGEYYNIARREVKKWMMDMEAIGEAQGIPMKTEVIDGAYSVVDTIIGYAESTSVDLIFHPSRKEGMVQDIGLLLLASRAQAVYAEASDLLAGRILDCRVEEYGGREV